MSERPDTDDYRQIFLSDAPMMDMRAPVEFAKGAFPTAMNLPLMSDEERRKVGTCYKLQGQEAAIELGNFLVSGDVKAGRIKAWTDFASANPDGYLYCFRGGLRSQTAQQWMREAGVDYPLVKGGYKALRRFLIEETERICKSRDFLVVGGRTGTGKTLLVHETDQSVDLEGLANHKGSSFGRPVDDVQPAQIDFENALAVDLLRLADRTTGPIILEDESQRIGRLALPLPVVDVVKTAPLLLVEENLQERIRVIRQDYVTDLLDEHQRRYGDEGFRRYAEFMLAGLDRIRKRLGGVRHADIRALLEDALDHQEATGEEARHDIWIERLLSDYYDPMYDWQLSKKEQPVAFAGSRAEVLSFIQEKARQNGVG